MASPTMARCCDEDVLKTCCRADQKDECCHTAAPGSCGCADQLAIEPLGDTSGAEHRLDD